MTAAEAWKAMVAAEAAAEHVKVKAAMDVVPIVAAKVGRKDQEHMMIVLLNGAHEVICTKVITKGLVNRTVVHPREVFREAIRRNATAIILGHNHPSGSFEPSVEDHEVTNRMKSAGKVVGIVVLDHIIVSKRGYFSFLERGQM